MHVGPLGLAVADDIDRIAKLRSPRAEESDQGRRWDPQRICRALPQMNDGVTGHSRPELRAPTLERLRVAKEKQQP